LWWWNIFMRYIKKCSIITQKKWYSSFRN
jgi:hypothetical protein